MEKNTSKVPEPAGESLLSGNGAGSRLFVINLCASMAPVQVPGKALPGLESYRLYQVARMEDGRTRHRLRLGFFTDENEAGMVLASVREQYPTAFTTCLCDEDQRFARGYQPASAGARAAPKKPVAVPAPASAPPVSKAATAAPVDRAIPSPKPQSATTVTQPATKSSAAAAQKTPEVARPAREAAVIELTWEPETATKPTTSAPPKSAPVNTTAQQASEIELTWEPPKADAKPNAPAAAQGKRDEVRLPPSKATIELKLEAEPAKPARAQATAAAPAQAFHVGKGAAIPDVKLDLASDAKSTHAQKANKPAAITKAAPASKPSAPAKPQPTSTMAQAAPTVAKPGPAAQKAAPAPIVPAAGRPAVTATSHGLDLHLPELDSTQTIRALTSTELADDNQEKWFAIQLAVSDQPVNLDAMPRLDIFEAYRLYSVATAGSGKIVHSLRLGFFREAVSAEAVSGYLKTFFGSPSVMRISVAEQLRFKDSPVRKTPAAGAKSESNVVALNARERNAASVPTVTVEVTPKVDTSATGSFKANNTGSFKANSTGTFKAHDTGSFKAKAQSTGSFKAGDTGSFKPGATGAHRTATAAKSAVATRSATANKMVNTGKFKATRKPTLHEELMEEAREVELSESGIRKLPKNSSLLARLVGKLTK